MTQEEYENTILRIMTEADSNPAEPAPSAPAPAPAPNPYDTPLTIGSIKNRVDPMSFTDDDWSDNAEMEQSKNELIETIKGIDQANANDTLYYDNGKEGRKNIVDSIWDFLKKFWIGKNESSVVEVDKDAVEADTRMEKFGRFFIDAYKNISQEFNAIRGKNNDELNNDIDEILKTIAPRGRSFIFSFDELNKKIGDAKKKWEGRATAAKGTKDEESLKKIAEKLQTILSKSKVMETLSPDYKETKTVISSPETAIYDDNMFWRMKSKKGQWPTRQQIDSGHIFEDMIKNGNLKDSRIANLSYFKRNEFGKRWLAVFDALLNAKMNDELKQKAFMMYLLMCKNVDSSKYPALNAYMEKISPESVPAWMVGEKDKKLPTQTISQVEDEIEDAMDDINKLEMAIPKFFDEIISKSSKTVNPENLKKVKQLLERDSWYMLSTVDNIINNSDWGELPYHSRRVFRTVFDKFLKALDETVEDESDRNGILFTLRNYLNEYGKAVQKRDNAEYRYNLMKADENLWELREILGKLTNPNVFEVGSSMTSGPDINSSGSLRSYIDGIQDVLNAIEDAEAGLRNPKDATQGRKNRDDEIVDRYRKEKDDIKYRNAKISELQELWNKITETVDTEINNAGASEEQKKALKSILDKLNLALTNVSSYAAKRLSKNAIGRQNKLEPRYSTPLRYSVSDSGRVSAITEKAPTAGTTPDYFSTVAANVKHMKLTDFYMNLWSIFDYATFKTADEENNDNILIAIRNLAMWVRRCLRDNMSNGPADIIKKDAKTEKRQVEGKCGRQCVEAENQITSLSQMVKNLFSDDRINTTLAAYEGKKKLLNVNTSEIIKQAEKILDWLDGGNGKISIEKMSDEKATSVVEALCLILHCCPGDFDEKIKNLYNTYLCTKIDPVSDASDEAEKENIEEFKRLVNRDVDGTIDIVRLVRPSFDTRDNGKLEKRERDDIRKNFEELKKNTDEIMNFIQKIRRVYVGQSEIMLGTLNKLRELLMPIFKDVDFEKIFDIVNKKITKTVVGGKKRIRRKEGTYYTPEESDDIQSFFDPLIKNLDDVQRTINSEEYNKNKKLIDELVAKKTELGETDEKANSSAADALKARIAEINELLGNVENEVGIRVGKSISKILKKMESIVSLFKDFDYESEMKQAEADIVVPKTKEKSSVIAPERKKEVQAHSINFGLNSGPVHFIDEFEDDEEESDISNDYVISHDSAIELCERLNSGEYDKYIKDAAGKKIEDFNKFLETLKSIVNPAKSEEAEEGESPEPVDPKLTSKDPNSIFNENKIQNIEKSFETLIGEITKIRKSYPIGMRHYTHPEEGWRERQSDKFFAPFYAGYDNSLGLLDKVQNKEKGNDLIRTFYNLVNNNIHERIDLLKDTYGVLDDGNFVRDVFMKKATANDVKSRAALCNSMEFYDLVEEAAKKNSKFQPLLQMFKPHSEEDTKAAEKWWQTTASLTRGAEKPIGVSTPFSNIPTVDDLPQDFFDFVANEINTYVNTVNAALRQYAAVFLSVLNLAKDIESIAETHKLADGKPATKNDIDRVTAGIIRTEEPGDDVSDTEADKRISKDDDEDEENDEFPAGIVEYLHKLMLKLYRPIDEVERELNENEYFGLFSEDKYNNVNTVNALIKCSLNWFNFDIEMVRRNSEATELSDMSLAEIKARLTEEERKINTENRNISNLKTRKEQYEKMLERLDNINEKYFGVLSVANDEKKKQYLKIKEKIEAKIKELEQDEWKADLARKRAQDEMLNYRRQRNTLEMMKRPSDNTMAITKDNWQDIVKHMEAMTRLRLVNKVKHDFESAWDRMRMVS